MRATSAWSCRCGYSNLGAVRCAGCRGPSAGLRRQIRRRRVVSGACIAISCMAASALWSPDRNSAKADLAPPAAPPPAPAPPHQMPATRPRQPRHTRPSAAPRGRMPGAGSTAAQDRCLAARRAVESAGDHLAPGFEYRCPDSEYPRWGATSVPPCGPCFVAINTADVGPNDAKLRHVVAHEFCHSHGVDDERAADECAAQYGFPNTYFRR